MNIHEITRSSGLSDLLWRILATAKHGGFRSASNDSNGSQVVFRLQMSRRGGKAFLWVVAAQSSEGGHIQWEDSTKYPLVI